uniref:Uncharacterized protein n=1 Tax=Tanacetum cinerariifolium TaxID=118510 RepID=A0A6L2NKN7_TANCI|nr:hypothetical protein [Tanacetum cinerariifolium]
MDNPNSLNKPNEDIPEENPVIPEPNHVEDAHDPNEMVDIPDDEDLVDHDGEDEEPEEEPKQQIRHGNQFAQHPNSQPGNINGWLEEDDDDWEDDVKWLMAPVMPLRATVTVSSTYEYRHGVLMRKMEEVSDAEVADNITIRDIHPRVAIVGEQVQVMESQAVQVVQTLQTALHGIELQNQQLQTRVAEMESHVGILMSYMLWMEERLTILEKRLPGHPSETQ